MQGEIIQWTFSGHRENNEHLRRKPSCTKQKRSQHPQITKIKEVRWLQDVAPAPSGKRSPAPSPREEQDNAISRKPLPKFRRHRIEVQKGTGFGRTSDESSRSEEPNSAIKGKSKSKSNSTLVKGHRSRMRSIRTTNTRTKINQNREKCTVDWIRQFQKRQSMSFMEEFNMSPLPPLPDSDSPVVFRNHGQVKNQKYQGV